MPSKKDAISIVIISCLLSIGLGWTDHETQSLIHLFTSDRGNLVALLLYAFIFMTIGFGATWWLRPKTKV